MTAKAPLGWMARGQRVLPAIALIAILGTLLLIGANARLLGRMTSDVQIAEAQSAALNNASREMLRLRQRLTELGETSDPDDIAIQLGLLGRQIEVSDASFPAGSPETAELDQIWRAASAFPWSRLPAHGGHNSPLRLEGMTRLDTLERRLNTVRSAAEQDFYRTTIQSLAAKRRSQTGLGLLVSVVLILGTASVLALVRRRRTDIAVAYDALKAEMGERHAAEQALRASEGRFRSLVQRASDLTIVTDADGTVTYVSPAVQTLLGYRPDDLLGLSLADHTDTDRQLFAGIVTEIAERPGAVQIIELRLRTQDGRVRTVETVCQNLLSDPDVEGVVWNGRDVTERRALEDKLTHQAHHDSLTELANRTLLLSELADEMERQATAGDGVCILLIDLDGFKNVNDTFGHSAGDELLQRTSERLRRCVTEGGIAARLGGDEFAVLVAQGGREGAVVIAQRVIDALRDPITVSGRELRISASIGIAHHSGSESAEDLLRDADIAMYAAKNTGKGRYELFEPGMRARASLRTTLQQHLARAVELGEITVHYQPVVDLSTARTVSLEALARWVHPQRGMVPPDIFIPIAEESGAIMAIGREVLNQACQAAQNWRASTPGQSELGVAVNISVHQVLSGQLVDHVIEALQLSGLPAPALTLEITESTLLESSARVTAEFARLKKLGVKIAVDDFGSGYSSLGFLLSLDADVLKIDRTLLDFDTTRHGSLVKAISELGRTLGLSVVAEGVETPEHLIRAQAALCDAAQGYLFARPLVAGDVASFLSETTTRADQVTARI